MTNGAKNQMFLNRITQQAKDMILSSIAKHYGTTNDAILEEVCDPEAESLLYYMVEPSRSAAYVLMQKHRIA